MIKQNEGPYLFDDDGRPKESPIEKNNREYRLYRTQLQNMIQNPTAFYDMKVESSEEHLPSMALADMLLDIGLFLHHALKAQVIVAAIYKMCEEVVTELQAKVDEYGSEYDENTFATPQGVSLRDMITLISNLATRLISQIGEK